MKEYIFNFTEALLCGRHDDAIVMDAEFRLNQEEYKKKKIIRADSYRK